MSTSRSLNKVMLIGNLTRDPVVKSTAKETLVCTFGIATNSTWRDSAGNVQERTEFHNVVAWNKLAEICAQLLGVGMSVYVEGELRTRTWNDANGNRHYRTEIKAQDMKLLDSKGKKGIGLDAAQKNASGNDAELVLDDEDASSTPSITSASAVVETVVEEQSKEEVNEAPSAAPVASQSTKVAEEKSAAAMPDQDNGEDLF